MSALAVSNDVLRASLRPPAPPSFSAWLEQHAADWFPALERWELNALDWLAERAPWQRCAIGAALGALIGLGAVLGVAGALGWERPEVAAAALMPHAVERAVTRAVLPLNTGAVSEPVSAVAEQTVAAQTVPEQVIEDPAPVSKPAIQAVKHRHKRSHSQHRRIPNRRSR
jgi:hypothetical protein